MKKILCLMLLMISTMMYAQDKVQLYDPLADARQDLNHAVQQAMLENKHILVQVGGNWCPWCIKLHDFFESQTVVDSILSADYVLVRINYSKENRNPETMALLGYPQRFGFPVLVVLDTKGSRLHTQNTGYLELDKGYSLEKVKGFLLDWNRAAIDPVTYQK
jgi:thioredoxin-related protein